MTLYQYVYNNKTKVKHWSISLITPDESVEKNESFLSKLQNQHLYNEESRNSVAEIFNFENKWKEEEKRLKNDKQTKDTDIINAFYKMRWKEGYNYKINEKECNVIFDVLEAQHRFIAWICKYTGSQYKETDDGTEAKIINETLSLDWIKECLKTKNCNQCWTWKNAVDHFNFVPIDSANKNITKEKEEERTSGISVKARTLKAPLGDDQSIIDIRKSLRNLSTASRLDNLNCSKPTLFEKIKETCLSISEDIDDQIQKKWCPDTNMSFVYFDSNHHDLDKDNDSKKIKYKPLRICMFKRDKIIHEEGGFTGPPYKYAFLDLKENNSEEATPSEQQKKNQRQYSEYGYYEGMWGKSIVTDYCNTPIDGKYKQTVHSLLTRPLVQQGKNKTIDWNKELEEKDDEALFVYTKDNGERHHDEENNNSLGIGKTLIPPYWNTIMSTMTSPTSIDPLPSNMKIKGMTLMQATTYEINHLLFIPKIFAQIVSELTNVQQYVRDLPPNYLLQCKYLMKYHGTMKNYTLEYCQVAEDYYKIEHASKEKKYMVGPKSNETYVHLAATLFIVYTMNALLCYETDLSKLTESFEMAIEPLKKNNKSAESIVKGWGK